MVSHASAYTSPGFSRSILIQCQFHSFRRKTAVLSRFLAFRVLRSLRVFCCNILLGLICWMHISQIMWNNSYDYWLPTGVLHDSTQATINLQAFMYTDCSKSDTRHWRLFYHVFLDLSQGHSRSDWLLALIHRIGRLDHRVGILVHRVDGVGRQKCTNCRRQHLFVGVFLQTELSTIIVRQWC